MIRLYKPGDEVNIAELEQICFGPNAWSQNMVRESAQSANYLFVCAEENKHVIGYISAMLVLDEVEICNVGVHPDYRRQHIGAQLMHFLQDIAESKCVQRILLEVRESNVSAQKFYESLQYVQNGIRKNFYHHPMESALLYAFECKKEKS